MNGTNYETAYVTARLNSSLTQQIFTRNTGTAPTVAPIVYIESAQAWLGQPETFNIAAPQDDLGLPTGRTIPFTLTDSDVTPSVAGNKVLLTGTTGITITRFDDGLAGQEITIISKGAIVFDTSPATRLIGSSVDITTAAGDVTKWVCETGGTTSSVWRLIGFVDVSVDNSAGA